jgi:chromosome segregation ATPase
MTQNFENITPPDIDSDSLDLDNIFDEILAEERGFGSEDFVLLQTQLSQAQRERDALKKEVTFQQQLVSAEKAEKIKLTEGKNILALEMEGLRNRLMQAEQRCMQLEVECLSLKQEMEQARTENLQLKEGMRNLMSSNRTTLNALYNVYHWYCWPHLCIAWS